MEEYLFNKSYQHCAPSIITLFSRPNKNHTIGFIQNGNFDEFTCSNITGLIYLPISKQGTQNAEKPYDFIDCRPPVWDDESTVMEWCYVSDFEADVRSFYSKEDLIESAQDLFEDMAYVRKVVYDDVFGFDWYKGGYDYPYVHGDGGLHNYVFPVYVTPVLRVSSETVQVFLKRVDQLNDELKDWHENEPVQDIVDPNLDPYLYNSEDVDDYITVIRKMTKNARRYTRRDVEELIIPSINDGTYVEPESLRLRRHMQWIPSEFIVRKDGAVHISTSINNLTPVPKNKKIYNCIRKIFEEMVPGFKQLNLIKENEDTSLQVIVKIQNYRIPPGGQYKGHWHLEGETENIVASGIYYPKVDEDLDGGHLKLRPLSVGDMYNQNNRSLTVTVQEGTSIVFSNCLPHRFEPITNPTNRELNRTFITFFIVDPKKPIVSTQTFMPAEEIHLYVQKWFSAHFGLELPYHIWTQIRKYLPNQCPSIEKAKIYRENIRTRLGETRSGWGYIHYGNCGEMSFLPAEKYIFEYEMYFKDTISL